MSDHFARLETALADVYTIEEELGSSGMGPQIARKQRINADHE